MSTRKLTLEEKVKIVQEAEQIGFTETSLKYNVSSRQIYRWRDKLQNGGSKARTIEPLLFGNNAKIFGDY